MTRKSTTDQNLESASTVPILLERISLYELYERMAAQRFEIYDWHPSKGLLGFDQQKIDGFALRYAEEYLSNINHLYASYKSKRGIMDIRDILNERLMKEIAKQWPALRPKILQSNPWINLDSE